MRAGYKQTKLGEIPEDWEVVNVDDFILNKKGAMKIGPFGSSLKKDTMISSGIKVYGQENIFEKNMSYGERYISHTHYEKLKSCELFAGDFIISMMGTIGKCMVVPEGIEKGIMDSHLLRLQLDLRKVQTSYLSQLFSSKLVLNQVEKLSHGGIMAGLSSKIIKQIIFSLPPLPEQQKIAHILSTVDEKIDLIAQQISETQALKKGLMQRLLTQGIGHTEFKDSPLGEIPVGWEVVKLGEVAKISAGSTPLRSNYDAYFKGGRIPWVKTLDLNNSEIIKTQEKITEKALSETSCSLLPVNTVLLAMYGGYNQIGRTGILRISAATNQAISALQVIEKEVLPEFLLTWLNFKIDLWKKFAASSRKDPNITKRDVENFPLVIPTQVEQVEINKIIKTVNDKLEVLSDKKTKYQALKKGLMQQLLTGKTRVTID